MAKMVGIEPTSQVLETRALPLSYTNTIIYYLLFIQILILHPRIENPGK